MYYGRMLCMDSGERVVKMISSSFQSISHHHRTRRNLKARNWKVGWKIID